MAGFDFNFSGLNGLNDNALANYLKRFATPQEEPSKTSLVPQRVGGITAFEIKSKSDIEYIEPDKSGQKQIYICEPENKIYTGRYNHVRKEMDYRAYIDEGEINLFQKQAPNAEMSLITEALTAVLNELKSMNTEIQALKNAPPKEIIKEIPVEIVKEIKAESSDRDTSGRFKKKGG